MKSSSFLVAICTIAVPSLASARPITLDEALAAAERAPAIASARATVDEAEGLRDQAGTIAYNPSLTVGAGPTFEAGRGVFDFQVGLGQTFELGGKRSKRARVATAERDAARATLASAQIATRVEAWRLFELALIARDRLSVASDNESAARGIAATAEERLRLGAGTQTEVNVAVAGVGRAVAARKAAEREALAARTTLANLLGMAGVDLKPTGTVAALAPIAMAEDAAVAAAVAARPDLAAVEHARQARAASVDLADALAIPDAELFGSWARSSVEGSDAFTVGVRIALPAWNRNEGNRRAARAASRRAEVELGQARRTVEQEVRVALRRYGTALDAFKAFDRDVSSTLDENLTLARESLAAGKLNLVELNQVRRDLVESRLARLDALVEAIESRAAFARALGRPLEVTP